MKHPVNKILLVNSYYFPDIVGGAEVVTQTLAETFTRLGIKTVVLTTSNKDRFEVINGVPVYRLHHKNIYWGKTHPQQKSLLKPLWHTLNIKNPILMPRIRDIIKKEIPDIVVTHNITGLSTGVWEIPRMLGIPVVHTLHDYSLLCLKTTMFKDNHICTDLCFSCRAAFSLKRKPTKFITHIIAVSRFVLNQHKRFRLFSNIPATVIYNPIRFMPKRQLQKSKDEPVFGYIGRLHASKGIEGLLHVFRDLPYQLKVAGKSPDPEFEKYLKEKFHSPRIHFLGFVNPVDFYKQIDILIIPSLWHDPSPTVVHEANAFGIPVIATPRGGLSEIVKPGINGLLYDPNNADALRDIINRFARDKYFLQELSESAYKHAQRFLPEHIAKRYLDVFQRVLGTDITC